MWLSSTYRWYSRASSALRLRQRVTPHAFSIDGSSRAISSVWLRSLSPTPDSGTTTTPRSCTTAPVAVCSCSSLDRSALSSTAGDATRCVYIAPSSAPSFSATNCPPGCCRSRVASVASEACSSAAPQCFSSAASCGRSSAVASRMRTSSGRRFCSTIRVNGASFGYIRIPGAGASPADAAPSEKCVAGISICPECAWQQSKCSDVASRMNLVVDGTGSSDTSSTSSPNLPRHARQRSRCSTSEQNTSDGGTMCPSACVYAPSLNASIADASAAVAGRFGAMNGRSWSMNERTCSTWSFVTPKRFSISACIGTGSPMSPHIVSCGTFAALSTAAVSSSDWWLKSTPTMRSGCFASCLPRSVFAFTYS
mmetsp:Transcript_4852/g.12791  ORF Transcript_4852/g.12791 Transcript_4852/m.12791 type:complete len:367 (-) Transcript_4852:919-2019(-)